MKFNLIRTGLQKLIDDGIETAAAAQAIAEINEIVQRLGKTNEIWQDECYILSADTVDQLMNEVTYDHYGRLYKQAEASGHAVAFNDYESVCRKAAGLEYAPLSMIQIGFDIVGDLYADNEANGCHNPDGTFNK